MAKHTTEPMDPLAGLETGRDRFLGRVLTDAFASGFRTADEFLGWFPPSAILSALSSQVGLRVKLLVQAGKLHHRIAARQSLRAASEDLELALDEGVATSEDVIDLLPIPALIRHLDPSQIWSFAIDGDWLERSDRDHAARAAQRVKLVVDTALEEGLITASDLAQGMAPAQLASRLEEDALRKVFVYALESARASREIDEAKLLSLAGLDAIAASGPVDQLWTNVVLGQIAGRAGLSTVSKPSHPAPSPSMRPAPRPPSSPPPPVPPPVVQPRAAATPRPAAAPPTPRPPSPASSPAPRPIPVAPRPASNAPRAPVPAPAPRPAPAPAPRLVPPLAPRPQSQPVAAAPSRVSIHDDTVEVDSDDLLEDDLTHPGPLASEEVPLELGRRSNAGESRAAQRRQAIVDLLTQIGRLPPRSEYLSMAILRSIALMYEQMKSRRTKAQRAQCVREAFDNDSHLRTALSGLVEMLDPECDAATLEALSSEALVDRLLQEERAIWQRSKRSSQSNADTLPPRRAVHVKAQAPPPSRR